MLPRYRGGGALIAWAYVALAILSASSGLSLTLAIREAERTHRAHQNDN